MTVLPIRRLASVAALALAAALPLPLLAAPFAYVPNEGSGTISIIDTAIVDGVSLRVPARSGHVLPLGLEIAGRRFDWVSAEFTGLDERGEPVFGVGLDPDGGTTLVVGGETTRLRTPQLVPSR